MAEFLSVSEIAGRTGKHPSTVRRWLRAGLLPGLPRPPRGWHRVSLDDLKKRLEGDSEEETEQTEH